MKTIVTAQSKVKKLIFTSNSDVYANIYRKLPNKNDDSFKATHRGLSKSTAKSYIRLFYELYRQSFTILRYAIVYGPRQVLKREDGVISVFFDSNNKGEIIMINPYSDSKCMLT
ncbi:NAD-dependent epimerase/dehydratase family protein [Psychrobacillus vulpis]|uniref:NAD-dependent epimerase/dehydratase family protein n=1 Tax=Psychrobacillus vulpis TaxID=2325572 RepID=A0A544TW51_9BACI|nr:NAD-dependent epimerase/dehydratase family protein [Psychrobacillus vulpis]TQR21666.1 NAD-dependent epimerase/dehydratase family protein [Psychrobacillus vulpis]